MKLFATAFGTLALVASMATAQEARSPQQATGKIKSASDTQLVITTSDGSGDQTYSLSSTQDSESRIVLGGKKSAASNLKENQEVVVCFNKQGEKLQATIVADRASQTPGQIKSISVEKLTLTSNNNDRQFNINQPATALVSDNKPAKSSDFKEGQQVWVIFMQEEDQYTALEIRRNTSK